MQSVFPSPKRVSIGRRLLAQLTPDLWPLPTLAWLAYTIALPVLDAWTGGRSFAWLSSLGVVLQLSAVLFILGRAWTWQRLVDVVGLAVPLTWAAEWLGSTTGFPFGVYQYTDRLQPQLLGVPALIPLAWMMMLPAAWAVASVVVSPRERLAFALVSAVAFTAWDLYLDPQMTARGLWVWAEPVGYFGIPWINFLGWLLTSFLVTFLCAPRDLPARPLAVIYTATWLLQAIGLGVFWGQPGPALVGFLAMGVFAVNFWRIALTSAPDPANKR